jgi:hypothetical protein
MMKKFALLAAAGAVSASSAQVTPVQKVIELLEGMLAKGKKEKHEEQVQFAAYKQFCDDTSVEKKRAISEAEEQMEKLNADISKATADAARLGREVAKHDADIATFQGDKKAATSVREMEKGDYQAMHQDYSESVDALERAITVLKKQAYDRKQAAAVLAQVDAMIPAEKKHVVAAFLAQDPEVGLGVSAPEANGYEFQSSSVVDMLEKLLDKFTDERTDLEKAEMNSVHAYDMLMQDLAAQIEQNTKARTTKSEFKAKRLQDAASAKSDLADTTATKNADSAYLSELTGTCTTKASDFESRQQLRADELVAVQKAIEIMGSGSVSGNAGTYLPSLAQTKKSALVQLKSALKMGNSNERVQLALAYLNRQSSKLNSRILAQVAMQSQQKAMSGAEDPFAKVKKMIKDLIVRLMEEANEEAEHKGWCDTELATNEATRKEKTAKVETLHAEIDELQASIAKLTEQVKQLTQEVAELQAAMAEATKLRGEEKAENEVTIADAKEARPPSRRP